MTNRYGQPPLTPDKCKHEVVVFDGVSMTHAHCRCPSCGKTVRIPLERVLELARQRMLRDDQPQ